MSRVISAMHGIGVGRIRTFPFSSDSAYTISWKPDCRSRNQRRKDRPITMHATTLCDWSSSSVCLRLGRDPFNQNFRKFRSKNQWISSVQPEKFRKNGSTFWGGSLLPVGPVGILVEWIAPLTSHLIVNDGVVGRMRTLFSLDRKVLRFWLRLRLRR